MQLRILVLKTSKLVRETLDSDPAPKLVGRELEVR